MKKNLIEEKKERTLLTDEEGLTKISAILSSHSKLYVEWPHLELQVSNQSIRRIYQLCGKLVEENVLFAYRVHNNQIIYEEEDSFLQSYRNKDKPKANFVIDTEDVVIDSKLKEESSNVNSNNNDNNAYDNLINQNTLANSNEIEQNVLDCMKNRSFFDRNINFFIFLWESFYLSLLLCGVFFFCHLSFFVFHSQKFLTPYTMCGLSINFLLFFIGFLGLYHIKIKKTQKINETNVNLILFTLVALTLSTFIYVEYAMEPVTQAYLLEQTFFVYLYLTMLTNEALCLIMNFKMNQFYVEYNFLLPLKYPLISDRVIDFIDEHEE